MSADMTEKEMTELQTELHQLQEIMRVMPGNVYWKDRQGQYLGCNENQRIVANLASISEIIGKTDYDLYTADIADRVRVEDIRVMETGLASVFEEQGVDVEGKEAIYLTKKMPLFSSMRQIVGLIGVSIDITAQKAAESREQLSIVRAAEAQGHAKAEEQMRQAVMVLTGSIVHDLRTPLLSLEMGILNLEKTLPLLVVFCEQVAQTEKLEKSWDSEKLSQMLSSLDSLKKTTRRMDAFIESTLKTLSVAVTGNQLRVEDLFPCSMNKCLAHTLEGYPFEEGERQIVHWQQGKDYHFMGNEILFTRVLYNLIKNALYQIHKNKRGEIFIYVECTPEVNVLRFKDTAGGVEPEVMKCLFQGYQTTKLGGTGIGLAYCQYVIKSFNGGMTCHSKYGDYIEFVMTFPVID